MNAESWMAWAAPWTTPLGHVLLDFLWQGAAIAACAWLLLRALRDARPQWRYALACIALLSCVCAPLVGLWRLRDTNIDTETAATAAALAPNVDLADSAVVVRLWSAITTGGSASIESALPWVAVLWSFGALCMLLRLMAGAVWVQRLRTSASDTIDAQMRQRFAHLCAQMGITRAVRLRTLAAERLAGFSPIAVGIVAPMVILPAALLTRLPSDLIDALIAHELAHICRHDYLINLLQTVIEALLFYHPAVWWLSRQIRQERELVADDLAARAIGAPRTLARALAELDRLHTESDAVVLPATRFPLTLSQAAHGGPLMSRIHSLIQPKRPNRHIGLGLPLIGLTAIALACLAYAQTDRPHPAQPLSAKESSAAGSAERRALPAPDLSTQRSESGAQSGVIGLIVNGSLDLARNALMANANRDGYAIVREGQDGFSISGNLDDVERVRDAQTRIGGDFMWFSRDGQAYVIRDPATLARVNATWASAEASETKMRALSAEMEAKSSAVQTLAEQVSAQAAERAMEAANIQQRIAQTNEMAAMQQFIEQQAELARQEAALANQYAQDPIGKEAEYEQQSAAIETQREALEEQMQAIETEMEAKGAQIEAEVEAKMAEMEAELEARLETATQPLEALGAQMEALGEEQERIMADVDRAVQREIDRALRERLAEPAPHAGSRQ
jgi:beta-lactamase regulating signal transducer with metallopeptidase domain